MKKRTTTKQPLYFSEPSAGGVAISSTTGEGYMVWQFGNKWECECAAYRVFHKPCKHITMLKAAVKTNKPGKLVNFFNWNE